MSDFIHEIPRSPRILLIEDDDDIATLIAARLRMNGYTVEFASDGEVGYRKAKETLPDLVILDLMLPSMPGEVICRELRTDADERVSSIPIMMLSAKSSELDSMIGRTIGADSYIPKPFESSEILSEIKRLINFPSV